MRLSKLGRALIEHRPERAGKGLVGFVSGLEGDAGDRFIGMLEAMCRPLQAKPPHMLFDALADHAPKDAVEMVGRKVCDPGEVIQRQRFVQMSLDVDEHP